MTEKQAEAIARIPYLRDGGFADLNLAGTLDYMRYRYVEPMKKTSIFLKQPWRIVRLVLVGSVLRIFCTEENRQF